MKSSMISLGGVIVTLIGLPVYAVMTKKNSELEEENFKLVTYAWNVGYMNFVRVR